MSAMSVPRSHLSSAGLLALALLVAVVGAALAQGPQPVTGNTLDPAPLVPDASLPPDSLVSPSSVLYDQLNNPSSSNTTSQAFEPSFATYDDLGADDFTVPSGQAWNVDLVEVDGSYSNGIGPAASVNVFFYSNAITLPGTLLAARTNISYTSGPGAGDFVLPLSPAVVLNPGAYWISVQARQDFNPAGQWYWTNRAITSTNPAVWQNPGGGFGTGCATWNVRALCLSQLGAADQMFRLSGTLLTVQFSSAAYSVNEAGGFATITATLNGPSPMTATVNYGTSNGTAMAGSDYVASSGTLTFTPGVTSRTFNVPIIDDALFEGPETFNVVLASATNAAIGSPASALVTIVDNDPAPPLVCGLGSAARWVLRSFTPIPVYGLGVASGGAYAYAVGGYSFQTGGDVTQTIRYDPVTNLWSALASIPVATSMPSAIYAPVNNKLYVFGGELSSQGKVYTSTRIYDIGSNTWSTGAPLPEPRAFMGGGYYNGKIYLAGGYSTGSVTPAYAQTWEYDVLANTWLTKTAMPQALGGPASAVLNGHLYVIGGRNGTSNAMTQTFDYDIGGNTWYTRTSIPMAGVNVPGTAVVGTKIWVIGGGNPFLALNEGSQPASLVAPEAFSDSYIYDPFGDSWSAGPDLNVQRSFVGATGMGNLAIAVGGYNGSTTTGATEVLQQCTVQFSSAAYSVNENAGSATITVTLSSPSAMTVTVNYDTSNGSATAGSDYVASSGTLTFTPGVTSRTFNVPIIDDALFEATENFNVTLSGATGATVGAPASALVSIVDNDPAPPMVCGPGASAPWVLRNFTPIPVYGPGVANDGTYAYAVGGYSFQTGGDVTQTIRYDPIANTWSALASAPEAVMMASVVYAPVNNKLYVFGGELAGTGRVFTTTRIYDIGSNTWSTGAPLPDARAFMGGGYYNGKIYLAGGYSTGNITPAYAQTWEYNVLANTWVTKTAMPQALGGPASAVAYGHLYIIGGRNITSSASTQTFDYDIGGNTWYTRTSIPTGVNVAGAAVLGGKIWVMGGGNPFLALNVESQAPNTIAPETFSATQIYDPIHNSWSAGPSLNVQRSFVGATGMGSLGIAVGGYNGTTSTDATEVTQQCFKAYLPVVVRNYP